MTFSVEQAGVSPGSPEGSEEHQAFLEGAYDSEPAAEETQAPADEVVDAPQDEEDSINDEETQDEDKGEDEDDAEDEDGEEELPPTVQAALDEVAKMKADLEEKSAGLDKYLTEKSEEFKKLREDAGVEETRKANKANKKELKGYGFKDDGEYIPRNFADATGDTPGMLSDKTLDHAVKQGVITAQQAGLAKSVRPVLNAALNDVRREVLEQVRDGIADVDERYKPIKQDQESALIQDERMLKWRGAYQTFKDKYKPTDEQVVALQSEIDESIELIDTMTPEQVERMMRRIINDPELLKKAAVKPRKPKPKKPEAEADPGTSQVTAPKGSYDSFFASMYD